MLGFEKIVHQTYAGPVPSRAAIFGGGLLPESRSHRHAARHPVHGRNARPFRSTRDAAGSFDQHWHNSDHAQQC
jgi:hypothetical protein